MALHDPRVNPPSGPATQSTGTESIDIFGRYLLFKRLKRDGLGEVYRAGEMGADAVKRMVSLRLFNGSEVDGQAFWTACQTRKGIESTLRGGAFGEITDMGCEDGIAFVAHEFVLGRTLAELLERSRNSSQPVPLELTLHIMDRIAIALQNARQRRLDEQRILHNFLIPDFVAISSEGEIQVTGFELSPGLLALSANGGARSHLAGYISPEVNAGQPPTAADDVYSLGALFAELLTGEPLPALNPAESSRWVDAAQLAEEGTPLPADVKHLLRESLLPRDERIQKAELWHRALLGITNAGESSATTFDLAFFFHTLFGDQLDRDVREVEAERRSAAPPPRPAPLPAPAVSVSESAGEQTEPADPPVIETDTKEEPEPAFDESPERLEPEAPTHLAGAESRVQAAPSAGPDKRLIAAVAALVAVGLVVAFFVYRPSGSAPDPIQVAAAPRVDLDMAPVATATVDGFASDISSVAPPLAPEEIEAQVRSLVAEQAGAMEETLKAEYDQRLVELRRQLEAAREAAAATPEETPEPPAQVAVAAPDPEPSEPAAAPERPEVEPQAAPARERVAQTPVPQPPTVLETNAQPAAVPASTQRPPARTRVAEPEVKAPAVEPEPEPEPEAVEPGTLVVQGPGVQPPRLTRQPHAVYPPAAARLKREATVRLRLLIDGSGRPEEVERIGKAVGMGFDQAALQAAKSTRWTPPTKDGVPVKMWVELSIDFRP